jgi:Glyoxalase-like domain
MGRDSLSELSDIFTSQGFQLTPLAHHNLGSSNRLIMLDSSYIELLGWEKDKPIQRAEIANQAIGLDALVFRTEDADACYSQLQESGFAVNPIQDLSREGDFMGDRVLVQFKTVRFSEQPIPGLRIYFCEHLTPEYVWQKQWLSHPNQIHHLPQINLTCPDIEQTANTFQELLNLSKQALISSPNTELT